MVMDDNEMLLKGLNGEIDSDTNEGRTEVFTDGLPCSVIVTNLINGIFDDENERAIFESLFQDIEATTSFHYFKSFRRVRINFLTPEQAAQARIRMHLTEFRGELLKCFLTQPITIGNSPHLLPPKREKQFLISPPASPPVGWAPKEEATPLINYDLVSAIAHLAPGEAHELHPGSGEHPAIVVHVSEEMEEACKSGIRIPQTKCPLRDDQ